MLSSEFVQKRNNYFSLGISQESKKDYKGAIDSYLQAIRCDKNFFDAWLNLGVLYSKTGKRSDAISSYHQALLCQQDDRAVYNLALEYYHNKQYTQSMETINQLSSTSTMIDKGKLLSAHIFVKLLQFSNAEKTLLHLYKKKSTNIEVLSSLVLFYYNLSDKKQCNFYLSHLQQIDNDNSIVLKMSSILQTMIQKIPDSVLEKRTIAQNDPVLNDIENSWHNKEYAPMKQKMEEKLSNINDLENKSMTDYFNLSLLSILQGKGEQAMDYLITSLLV